MSQELFTEPVDDSHIEENLENFNVHDFLKQDFKSLEEKASAFSYHINKVIESGFILREVTGHISKETFVKDSQTGEIQRLLMFGSNNYQDMAREPYVVQKVQEAIAQFGIGCGGPPLLNGNTSLHIALQQKLAQIKGGEKAILFSSGYSANVGWSTALLGKGDWLVHDVQSHGSLYDGMKMGDFNTEAFPHNDCEGLVKRLRKVRRQSPSATVVVAVEGVYSMDGELAPLPDILKICRKYNALLCVDDAHGSGVMGKYGHGIQEHFGMEGQIDILMGTFSKAYSVTGGYVTGKKEIIDYMLINARSYLFSASLPPTSVAAVLGCIEFFEQNPQRIAQLHRNAKYMADKLNAHGLNVNYESAILPVFIPQHINMKVMIRELQLEGLFVNGIEFPSVPRSRQRLRISLMSTFTQEELDFAVDKIVKVCRKYNVIP